MGNRKSRPKKDAVNVDKSKLNETKDHTTDVNKVGASDPNAIEKKTDSVPSTPSNESEGLNKVNVSADSRNQETKTALNSSTNADELKETSAAGTSSTHDESMNGKLSKETTKLNSASNPNESNGAENMDTSPDHNKHEVADQVHVASNNSEDERMDNSTSSDKHGAKGQKKSKTTSVSSKEVKRKPNSETGIDSDEYERPNDSHVSYTRHEPDLITAVLETAKKQKLLNRLLGCAYGQALGDAYGLSTEFEDRDSVASLYRDSVQIIPFPKYEPTGHNRRWTQGDWTDDTDQWILILETLMEDNADVSVFAQKLTNWIRNGFRELGDYGGMGLGANVSQVVRSPGYINDPLRISQMVWERGNRQAAPNGALMRCSASAFVHFNDIEKLKETTILMCQTTHFDPRCIASCLAVCLTVTYLINGDYDDENIESLVKRVQKETIEILGDSFSPEHRELFIWHTDEHTLEDLNLDEPRTIGYTYKCLASGFYGLRSKVSFGRTLNDLIRYGGDADTNGAVCGTMFGARYGYEELPYKWLRAMPYKKWFDQKIIKYLQQMNVIDAKNTKTNE